MESNQLSFSHIIAVLKSNIKKILAYSILTSVIIAGLSLLLPNYYKSSVVFYVNNTKNLNPKIIFSDDTPPFFGTDDEIERIRLLSKSKDFQHKMINEFNLIEYFEIDTTSVKKRSKIYKKLNSILKLIKDKSETLILEIEHKDPEIASKMANKAVDYLEKMNSKLIASFLQEQEAIFNSQLETQENDLKEISDKISSIKKEYYISIKNIDAEKQTIGFTSDSENHQESFNKGIDEFIINRQNYLTTSENKNEIVKLKLQYNTIVNSINNNNIKSFTIIEQAYPNYIKDNPKRSFIVIGIFFFSILSFTLAYTSNRQNK